MNVRRLSTNRLVVDILPPRRRGDSNNEAKKFVELAAMILDEGSDTRYAIRSMEEHNTGHGPCDAELNEFEAVLAATHDPVAELLKIGGILPGDRFKNLKKEEDRFENSKFKRERNDFEHILAQIRKPIKARVAVNLSNNYSAASGEAGREFKDLKFKSSRSDGEISKFKDSKNGENKFKSLKSKSLNFVPAGGKRRFGLMVVVALAVGIFSCGFVLKNRIIADSNLAFENLERAKSSLENLDFGGAADNFKKSYDGLIKAERDLNIVSGGLASLADNIGGNFPGGGKLKSAKDMIEAGKLAAEAGRTMAVALAAVSKTGAILNPHDREMIKPGRIISQLKDAFALAVRNLAEIKIILENVDESAIPENKKETFKNLKFRDLKIFEDLAAGAAEYADFLELIVGIDQPKKYLMLFQNNSELRPTGGFAGSYGVVSFAGGGLQDFFVGDIYNLDGQLKRKIVPPEQLRHITPIWGLRDAAWFADFPASAEKVTEFFREEAGYGVDGVVTVNPDIVAGILEIVGPVEMPEYGMVLDSDNFLAGIQEEIEYGDNRVQPKTVLVDFAPRFLEKLYSADSGEWLDIFRVFGKGLAEKDILLYFNDPDAEKFAVDRGFGGEIEQSSSFSDYLTVNFSNIKGSKTDAVTSNYLKLAVKLEPASAGGELKTSHTLLIARRHNGGGTDYGFYNRQNPAYVRVLIPENAVLTGITGHDRPDFKPLVNYDDSFERDSDLENFESGFVFDGGFGIDRFAESGKQGIGFWLITDPGETAAVELEYEVPVFDERYGFYFQKQPGLDWDNFQYMFSDIRTDVFYPDALPAKNSGDYSFSGAVTEDFKFVQP